jgi:quinol-cytochrome oxidoreductase complex cytochrome b subunit
MWTGVLLALYYLPDPALVITLRMELMAEVWWYPLVYRLHVIGVDTIFIFSYFHLLKKLALKNYATGDADGWVSGTFAFLLYHLAVFFGITLSTNHLGEVTVMIAANMY